MTYRVEPVREGYAVLRDQGSISPLIRVLETREDAERICGDLNRFDGLFEAYRARQSIGRR